MRKLILLAMIVSLAACQNDANFSISDGSGIGSSTARFTIVGDYMYIVDHTFITTLDITIEDKPVEIDKQEVGFGIETIFPYEDFLFIGSTNGMYIYEIADNGIPFRKSSLQHFQSCDPVVANSQYAFVTLRSGGDCRIGTGFWGNVLEVVDVSDIDNPNLVNQYEMTHPGGLGLDGNTLFVADSYNGVVVFDVTEPVNSLAVVAEIKDSYEALDLIALNGILIVISSDNMYQYDYTDLDNIQFLSKISIKS